MINVISYIVGHKIPTEPTTKFNTDSIDKGSDLVWYLRHANWSQLTYIFLRYELNAVYRIDRTLLLLTRQCLYVTYSENKIFE